jgi:hypothetical protein
MHFKANENYKLFLLYTYGYLQKERDRGGELKNTWYNFKNELLICR